MRVINPMYARISAALVDQLLCLEEPALHSGLSHLQSCSLDYHQKNREHNPSGSWGSDTRGSACSVHELTMTGCARFDHSVIKFIVTFCSCSYGITNSLIRY